MATRGKQRPSRKTKPRARASRPKRRTPESLRARSITPSFTVNDLQRSIGWYEGVLGFTISDRWEMGVELKAGSTLLMINQDDWSKGRDREKGVGMRIYLSTTQDLDRLASDITSRGGMLTQPPTMQTWGSKTLDLTDPDGFRLTFVQDRR